MISSMDVGVLDRNSERLGTRVCDLMEAAGKALAEEIMARSGHGKVVIVAGTGNNGGDGMVAARYLAGWKVPVVLVMMRDGSRIRTEIARQAFRDLPADVPRTVLVSGGIRRQIEDALDGAGAVVDGLLGSGARGELSGEYAEAVAAMNGFDGSKFAIDSPTGLGQEGGFHADVTVTFHDVKEGMAVDGRPHPNCGEIVVRDIGIPGEAALYVGPGDLLRVPNKPHFSRKGETGRVLIVGGGPFTGAPSLSALAAVRTGADLVTAAVPRGIADVVASFSPDLIVERLHTLNPYRLGPEVVEDLRSSIDRSHSVLIGPGAGSDRGTLHLLKGVLDTAISAGKPVVVDADGLTAISRFWRGGNMGANVLLTPHRGELRRLTESLLPGVSTDVLTDPYEGSGKGGRWNSEALELVSRLRDLTGATFLVKGPVDLILTDERPSLSDHVAVLLAGKKYYRRFCTSGVPAMSVGGTGDVLAGLCAGLLARGLSAFDAACVAAYVNGTAGEEAYSSVGHSLSATEVLSRVKLVPPG